jgi:hypothetical protein
MAPKASYAPVYLYNSYGHALSGTITRPFHDVLESQAAASLSARGGHGSSAVSSFSYRNLVSFKVANTHVSGSDDADGNHTSVVSVCVEGLNIIIRRIRPSPK